MIRVAAGRQRFFALSQQEQGLVAILAAAVLWSTGGLFIKWVSLDAIGITLWRSVFAGLTLALVFRVPLRVPPGERLLTFAIALSYAAMLLLFVVATRLTTAANAIFLQYTAPLYVVVLSRWLLAERPSAVDVGCVVVAVGGMALFFVGRIEASDVKGNLCAIASGIAFALFLTFSRWRGSTPNTRPRAMVLGNAGLAIAMLVALGVRRDSAPFTPSLDDAAALVFLGVVQIGLAYVCFTFAIARITALEAALIGMLEPVLNPVWVFLALDERPGWWAVAGGAVIIAAIVLRTWHAARPRPRRTAVAART